LLVFGAKQIELGHGASHKSILRCAPGTHGSKALGPSLCVAIKLPQESKNQGPNRPLFIGQIVAIWCFGSAIIRVLWLTGKV
ncbi:MAG: hypothetical protein ACREFI_07725, partial [Stellaceae bacterium]